LSSKSIIIISNTFYPAETGGPDNSTFWLSKVLSGKYEVYVLSTNKGLEKNNLIKNNIVLNKKNNFNHNLKVYYHTTSLRLFKSFLNLLLQKKGRIVILNSIFLKKNLFFILFSFIFKVKTYLYTRGELDNGALKFKSIKKHIYLRFLKLYIKEVVFVSTTLQEKAFNKKFFNNKNIVIPNLIDKKYEKIDTKKNNYIYFGRIHPKKNIEYIIKGFIKFKKIPNKQKLYVVGKIDDYNYYKKIKQMAYKNKDIIFQNPVDGKKKYKYLSRFKALIITSLGENFGNVIIESLSVGTVCIISSNLPWNNIEKNKVGFHVNISDTSSLSATLSNIDSLNKKDFDIMSKNCEIYLKKYFNKSTIERKILNSF